LRGEQRARVYFATRSRAGAASSHPRATARDPRAHGHVSASGAPAGLLLQASDMREGMLCELPTREVPPGRRWVQP
jgi:hypothetical protein